MTVPDHTTTTAGDDDAALDACLATVDTAALPRLEAALDLDAGLAAIFASCLPAETVPPEGSTDEELPQQLEGFLSHVADGIEKWLALPSPACLPVQLEEAIRTIRTMTVVGRALLPESLQATWGLATDFLTACQSTLYELKTGLAQRILDREQALDLHHRIGSSLDNFLATMRKLARQPCGHKAQQVSERLVNTGETLQLLLTWARRGIEQLFNDADHITHMVPVA